jgi:hypothetical protein
MTLQGDQKNACSAQNAVTLPLVIVNYSVTNDTEREFNTPYIYST